MIKIFKNKDRLHQILEIDRDLDRIKDLDILLDRLLFLARREARADAGTVYMHEDGKLAFTHSQNDTLQRRLKPNEKLPYKYFTVPIDEKSISGFVAKNEAFLNISNMYAIDENLPYNFNASFDEITGYKTISSLTFPLITGENELLGVMQLINAKDLKNTFIPFRNKDVPFFEVFARFAAKAIQRAKMTRNLLETISRFACLRDPTETGAHVNRVGAYSMEIYEAWAYKHAINVEKREKNKDNLRMASMLHDVGKVGISDVILNKPGKLTEQEYRIIQSHTWIGAGQFHDDSELSMHAKEVTLHHHENWDGNGYPGNIDYKDEHNLPTTPLRSGLKGEQIPLFARIVSIADVYDALSAHRVYKKAWEEERILSYFESESGKKFDPELVELFFDILPNIRNIQQRYTSTYEGTPSPA